VNESRGLQVVSPDHMLARANQVFDAIARRAFEIFDGKGHQLGRDLDDWLQAERELLRPVQVSISESAEAVTVAAEVPGFREEDIKVSAEPRRLTISGKRESRTEKTVKGKAVYGERRSDEIFRVIDLPATVDATDAAVKATYKQGVVTVTLPKAKTPSSGR